MPGGGGETAGPHAGHRWLRAGPERWHEAQARGTPRPRVDLCCEAKKQLPCLPAAHGPGFPGCRYQLLGAPGQPRPGRGLASSSLRGDPGHASFSQGPRTGMQGPQGPVLHPQSKKVSLSSPVTRGQESPLLTNKNSGTGTACGQRDLPMHTAPGRPPEGGPSPRPLWSALLLMGRSWDRGRGQGLCQPSATVLRRPNEEGQDGRGWPRAAPSVARPQA